MLFTLLVQLLAWQSIVVSAQPYYEYGAACSANSTSYDFVSGVSLPKKATFLTSYSRLSSVEVLLVLRSLLV